MRKKIWQVAAKSILVALFVLAPLSLAQAQVSGDVGTGLQKVGTQINATGSTGIFNPQDSAVVIIAKVIKILLFVSGAVAVLFVVIGGFMYLTSAGNEEQATKGRKTITYALVGLVIIIMAYVIVSVIVNLVQQQSVFGF